jgi:hypothetical protein
VDMLDRLDPHRVFSTPFLDRLMPRSRDLTGDGQVNGADLANRLSKWGEGATPADLNADGVVNGADLAELLGRWTGGVMGLYGDVIRAINDFRCVR